MSEPADAVLSDWARLGILFNVPAGRRTPDLERLLIRTAEEMPHNARLLPAVLTWLTRNERLVARHRLAQTAKDVEPAEVLPRWASCWTLSASKVRAAT